MCYHAEFRRSALKGVSINTGETKKNWEALEIRSLGIGGVADPKIHAPPHMCYHVKFGRPETKNIRINRNDPQNWRSVGIPPHCVMGVANREICCFSTCVILSNLVVLGLTVGALLRFA